MTKKNKDCRGVAYEAVWTFRFNYGNGAKWESNGTGPSWWDVCPIHWVGTLGGFVSSMDYPVRNK